MLRTIVKPKNAVHHVRAAGSRALQRTPPQTTALQAQLVRTQMLHGQSMTSVGRQFSNYQPPHQPLSDQPFEVRTFRDGTKAIELTAEQQQVMDAAPTTESQKEVRGPFTTFNYIRTVQYNFLMQARGIFLSKEKKDDDDNVPEGFKKFLKKTRKGAPKKEEAGATDKKDGDKKAKEQKKDDDDDISELEEETETTDKDKKESKGSGSAKKLKEFFYQPNGKDPKWENILLVAFLTGAFGYYLATMKPPSEEITYSEFINNYLGQNQCTMITISEDKSSDTFKFRAVIDTTSGKKVHMVLPQVENFLYKLDLAQREMGTMPQQFVPVKFANQPTGGNENFMMNYLIGAAFLALLVQLYRTMHGKGGSGSSSSGSKGGGLGGGGMGNMFQMGKSNVQVFGIDKKIKVRFKHVAGMQQAKTEVMEFVDFLKKPDKYKKLGAKIPRGALLVGPPGTGKTMLAKAVAGEAGVPFFSISGSDFVEMFVGVGASRVRDLFKKAKEKSPSIIFIDEIDAVAKKRHGKFGGNDERDNTLNQLLVEMDGFTTDQSVIILAATNRADILDSALKRPGRFDRQIEITTPSIDERAQIYRIHLKKIKLNPEKTRTEYSKAIASLTPGFSGADIANVVNEAAIIAARENLTSVGMKQFEMATERVLGGIEKKSVMTKEERRRVAYHEAGHAVAGWFLENSDPLLKITIIPRSKGSLGFAQYLPSELSLYSKEQLLDMIKTALGGRIAEEIFYESVTTGASDDINKVTQIAQGLVQTYGMTSNIGLVGYGSMGGDDQFQKPYSDETNWEIDEEVRNIVREQYKITKELLLEHKDKMQALGDTLLEKETIGLPQIIEILGERPYGMNETAQKYLAEMMKRQSEEDADAAKAAEQEEDDEADDDGEDGDKKEESDSSSSKQEGDDSAKKDSTK